MTAVCEFKALPEFNLGPIPAQAQIAGIESQTALLDTTWWFMNSL